VSNPNSLWVPLVLPDPKASDYPEQLNQALAAQRIQLALFMEKVLLNNSLSPLRVGTTTIDQGSASYTFASGTTAKNAFKNFCLPTVVATTSASPQTAVSYNGKGVLQAFFGISQSSAGTSTAAGVNMVIAIDGVQVWAGGVSANNQVVAGVGQLGVTDPVNDYVIALNDPVGLTFNKNVTLSFDSATSGQAVQVGWRILKLA